VPPPNPCGRPKEPPAHDGRRLGREFDDSDEHASITAHRQRATPPHPTANRGGACLAERLGELLDAKREIIARRRALGISTEGDWVSECWELPNVESDDVVDPGDAALQALLASPGRTDDDEKRERLLDAILTIPPLTEWPLDCLEKLWETCQFVICLSRDLRQRTACDGGD
jgi:hypothetical protein